MTFTIKMPLLPKNKVTKKLPSFFFGPKSKRKNSKSVSEDFNQIEPGEFIILFPYKCFSILYGKLFGTLTRFIPDF